MFQITKNSHVVTLQIFYIIITLLEGTLEDTQTFSFIFGFFKTLEHWGNWTWWSLYVTFFSAASLHWASHATSSSGCYTSAWPFPNALLPVESYLVCLASECERLRQGWHPSSSTLNSCLLLCMSVLLHCKLPQARGHILLVFNISLSSLSEMELDKLILN